MTSYRFVAAFTIRKEQTVPEIEAHILVRFILQDFMQRMLGDVPGWIDRLLDLAARCNVTGHERIDPFLVAVLAQRIWPSTVADINLLALCELSDIRKNSSRIPRLNALADVIIVSE